MEQTEWMMDVARSHYGLMSLLILATILGIEAWFTRNQRFFRSMLNVVYMALVLVTTNYFYSKGEEEGVGTGWHLSSDFLAGRPVVADTPKGALEENRVYMTIAQGRTRSGGTAAVIYDQNKDELLCRYYLNPLELPDVFVPVREGGEIIYVGNEELPNLPNITRLARAEKR